MSFAVSLHARRIYNKLTNTSGIQDLGQPFQSLAVKIATGAIDESRLASLKINEPMCLALRCISNV